METTIVKGLRFRVEVNGKIVHWGYIGIMEQWKLL